MIKSKRILRFYFKADELNRALDNLIINCACSSADCTKAVERYADKIIKLIGAKGELAGFWRYLDGVISALNERDRDTLREYSLMRCGIKRLNEVRQREIKRAVIKFVRHARSLDRFKEGLRLVGEYYCLI